MEKGTPWEHLPQNSLNKIHHVIAIMSGKGGVGKSSLSALLACALAKRGDRVGILDADITGPSIPRLFGLTKKPLHSKEGNWPIPSKKYLIKIISLNLFLEQEDEPVIWRGPIISSTVRQFFTDVIWEEIDYLIVDLPPGTGDAPLTVMKQIPLKGIVVVTSPQDLAAMVVKKAVKMAVKLDIPVLGMIENMSAINCPYCQQEIALFGPKKGNLQAKKIGIPFLGSLPLDPSLVFAADHGFIEEYDNPMVQGSLKRILEILP